MPLDESELHLGVVQVGLRSLAAPIEGVHLLTLFGELAVLPVLNDRRTLATIVAAVLEGGRLHCLPPATST